MTREVGRIEQIDLRDIWASEAQDFTPWLAQEHNLGILSSVLGIDLEFEAQEESVGSFRADILCKNRDDNTWVLVENQLARTDHSHLGQLLTYAAGLQAVTIVWIAATFTDEHRAALDWLNEITDDTFQFFGLEIKLWRIGDSPAAPYFNVVSKPNDWRRSVSKAAKRIANDALTETKEAQLNYWVSFKEYLSSQSKILRPQKPVPRHWSNFSLGRAGFKMAALLNSRDNRISVEFAVRNENTKAYFDLLLEQRDEIESELGFVMEWMELPNKKTSRVVLHWDDLDPLDTGRWPEYHQWMKDNLERLHTVLGPRIRDLNVGEWNSSDGVGGVE